jgi:hypothetical protein
MARKPAGLARRRKDAQRMKEKARRLYPHDKTGSAANHLTVCSCGMCGNPRRHFGTKTISELREEERAAYEIQDIHEKQADCA